MKNLTIGFGIGLATLLGANAVLAEPFASHGTLAVGAENVFGIDYAHSTSKATGATEESTSSTTSISLLGHMSGFERITTIRQLPRLSLDVFLGPGISLGGGVMYQHVGNSDKDAGATSSEDSSQNYYLFAPRVGFGIPINENFAIWPRLGISYLYTTGERPGTDPTTGAATTNKSTSGLWFTTIDALFLVSPVEHVAFNFGPSVDVLIGGPTVTYNGVGVDTGDVSMYSLGLNAGLTVWF